MMDVQVIGNIDQQLIGKLSLNPRIEDRRIVGKVYRGRLFKKNLDVDMLYVHGSLPIF
jgi:hypothetical protein